MCSLLRSVARGIGIVALLLAVGRCHAQVRSLSSNPTPVFPGYSSYYTPGYLNPFPVAAPSFYGPNSFGSTYPPNTFTRSFYYPQAYAQPNLATGGSFYTAGPSYQYAGPISYYSPNFVQPAYTYGNVTTYYPPAQAPRVYLRGPTFVAPVGAVPAYR